MGIASIHRVLADTSDVNFASLGVYSGEVAAWNTAQATLQVPGSAGLSTGTQLQTDMQTEQTYLNTVVAGYIALGYVPVGNGASGPGSTWLGVAQARLNWLNQEITKHIA